MKIAERNIPVLFLRCLASTSTSHLASVCFSRPLLLESSSWRNSFRFQKSVNGNKVNVLTPYNRVNILKVSSPLFICLETSPKFPRMAMKLNPSPNFQHRVNASFGTCPNLNWVVRSIFSWMAALKVPVLKISLHMTKRTWILWVGVRS